jgi:hypothetical protein
MTPFSQHLTLDPVSKPPETKRLNLNTMNRSSFAFKFNLRRCVTAFLRRAGAREHLDDAEGALADYEKVANELEKGHKAATVAAARLRPLVDAKREQMKAWTMPLVHFSAQPEPVLSSKPPTASHIKC